MTGVCCRGASSCDPPSNVGKNHGFLEQCLRSLWTYLCQNLKKSVEGSILSSLCTSLWRHFPFLNTGSTVCTLGPRSPPLLEERPEQSIRILVCVRYYDNSSEYSNLYGLRELGQAKQRFCGYQWTVQGIPGIVYSCDGFTDSYAGTIALGNLRGL